MLEYIKGTLTEALPHQAVIEIGGLGYRIHIPLSTYAKLPKIGTETTLYTSTVIREDSHKVFGFIDRGQRNLFEKCNNISGIGPKTSLALVGHLEIADLQMAVATTNITLLCKVPGIGKKTAERIVLEMKDLVLQNSASSPFTKISGEDSLIGDAINALINLGYQPLDSQKAVKKALESLPGQKDLPLLITTALKKV